MDYGGYDSYIWWYNFNGTSSTSDDTWASFWTVAHDHAYYMARNQYDGPGGSYVTSATQLSLGDVIYYDFADPNNPNGDGYFDHSAIVIGFSNGQPLVAYNTSDVCSAYWDLGAKLTKFLHLRDSFFYN